MQNEGKRSGKGDLNSDRKSEIRLQGGVGCSEALFLFKGAI